MVRVGADHSTPSFTDLADLASSRVGGKAIATNDDFFASKDNLVNVAPPIFIPGKFTSRGKWMDGWESRRRRTPGHDWCIVQLGLRGVVHGVNVDTRFFTGNYPSHCSIDALDLKHGASRVPGRPSKRAAPDPFVEILSKSALRGDGDNILAIADRRPWTHLRLNI
jgi:allantoicase